MLSDNISHIPGIILTGVIGLEGGGGDLVGDQTLGALRLCHLGGSIVKDHVHNVDLAAIDDGYRHGGGVRTAFGGISYGNDGVRLPVRRQLKEIVQLVLVEEKTLASKGCCWNSLSNCSADRSSRCSRK